MSVKSLRGDKKYQIEGVNKVSTRRREVSNWRCQFAFSRLMTLSTSQGWSAENNNSNKHNELHPESASPTATPPCTKTKCKFVSQLQTLGQINYWEWYFVSSKQRLPGHSIKYVLSMLFNTDAGCNQLFISPERRKASFKDLVSSRLFRLDPLIDTRGRYSETIFSHDEDTTRWAVSAWGNWWGKEYWGVCF